MTRQRIPLAKCTRLQLSNGLTHSLNGLLCVVPTRPCCNLFIDVPAGVGIQLLTLRSLSPFICSLHEGKSSSAARLDLSSIGGPLATTRRADVACLCWQTVRVSNIDTRAPPRMEVLPWLCSLECFLATYRPKPKNGGWGFQRGYTAWAPRGDWTRAGGLLIIDILSMLLHHVRLDLATLDFFRTFTHLLYSFKTFSTVQDRKKWSRATRMRGQLLPVLMFVIWLLFYS